ncbi:coiled-coil domain-containing protein 71 [Rhinophrynus dorsalis]
MKVDVAHMEEKALHSWSRISSAGKRALEEALRVFNPMSKDLTNTETQLVTFLQGLREEGYHPTILSSKDVYGYHSKTANAPHSKKKHAAKNNSTASSKTQSKNTSKVSNASVALSVNSSKTTKPSSKVSANILLSSLKQTGSEKAKDSAVGFPSNMYPGVYPAMRLSVVLEALVPFKATAKLKQHPVVTAQARQSSKGKSTKGSSEYVDSKTYQCLIKKMPTLGYRINPLNGAILIGPNGRILKENNACKVSGIFNGRLSDKPSQKCNGLIQAKHNSKVSKTPNLDVKPRQADSSKKRKLGDVQQAVPEKKMKKCVIPLSVKSSLNRDKFNLLRSKVIKVNRSFSDDEVRRRAQKILQVNLSPVIRIPPLSLSVS